VYTTIMSDNPISADNQQERLLITYSSSEISSYIAGFSDGEGSFNISFRKRKDYKLPWKISACFNISQKDKSILEMIRNHLGCGTLRSRPDDIWYFEVNDLEELHSNIIPFFLRCPFLSQKKQRDFKIFQKIITLIRSKHHLSKGGVEKILDFRRNMNDGGKRKYSESDILDAYQKNPQRLHAKLALSKGRC